MFFDIDMYHNINQITIFVKLQCAVTHKQVVKTSEGYFLF